MKVVIWSGVKSGCRRAFVSRRMSQRNLTLDRTDARCQRAELNPLRRGKDGDVTAVTADNKEIIQIKILDWNNTDCQSDRWRTHPELTITWANLLLFTKNVSCSLSWHVWHVVGLLRGGLEMYIIAFCSVFSQKHQLSEFSYLSDRSPLTLTFPNSHFKWSVPSFFFFFYPPFLTTAPCPDRPDRCPPFLLLHLSSWSPLAFQTDAYLAHCCLSGHKGGFTLPRGGQQVTSGG